jgi:nicotinate phosphoribosyltransferase
MSTALLTDRYELTMVQASLHSGMAHRRAIFEVFCRQLPAGRRYGVVAGTGRLLDLIRDFRFGETELAFLQEQSIVDSKTLDWLSQYRFSGDILGYREGELYFGESPVLTVKATFAEAVVLETLILSVLNFDSAIAAAASRMRIAAGKRTLIEMGSRRGQEHSAVAAARAAYIAGFDFTSNLEAGRLWGVPTLGTAAHSFTLIHDTEAAAFQAQIEAFGPNTTLLVDTFDTAKAIATGVNLAGIDLGGIRLDSGDLSQEAAQARRLLDSLGADSTRITVTSDLDEYAIASLAAEPIDSYGVGTSLITGSGHPTAGFVYKLVAHSDNGNDWTSVAKTSRGKQNRGGEKRAFRRLSAGRAIAERVTSQSNPQERELQVSFCEAGAPNTNFLGQAGVLRARDWHQQVLNELPESARRMSKGEPAIELEFED